MYGFLSPLLFSLTGLAGPALAVAQGNTAWAFITIILALIVIPLTDLILPQDTKPPTEGPADFFDSILFIYTIFHVMLIIWGASFVAVYADTFKTDLPLILGTITSVGMVSGAIGVTFAHELVHRQSPWQRLMGEVILVSVCFGHFAVSHVYGHHRHVGTPEDPATARRGQSLYGFFIQAIPGVFLCSFRIKPRRTLVYTFSAIAIAVLFGFVWGWLSVVYFFAQSLIAIGLTETVDYIEHYGLERKKLPDGRYEPFATHHAWDSDRWMTGKLLIHLQRHSDHHLHASKHYPSLELHGHSHQLPTGYAGCLILAFFPPLWRKVMDHRI
jgi:alkane 1-monooxygenase